MAWNIAWNNWYHTRPSRYAGRRESRDLLYVGHKTGFLTLSPGLQESKAVFLHPRLKRLHVNCVQGIATESWCCRNHDTDTRHRKRTACLFFQARARGTQWFAPFSNDVRQAWHIVSPCPARTLTATHVVDEGTRLAHALAFPVHGIFTKASNANQLICTGDIQIRSVFMADFPMVCKIGRRNHRL